MTDDTLSGEAMSDFTPGPGTICARCKKVNAATSEYPPGWAIVNISYVGYIICGECYKEHQGVRLCIEVIEKQLMGRFWKNLPVTGDATDTIHALMRSLMQDKPSGKVSRSWMYAAIRHSDRNCEFEKENDGDALSRYDGEIIADILNILADKSCIMMTEAPCCIMMTEAP